MFSTTKITSFLAAFFALAYAFAAVDAAPLESRKALDVFSPPILYPNAMTTWFAGQSHNVTWDASNPPKTISNGASIVLKTADFTSGWTPVTLASGFSLLDGRHQIQVPPDVTSRDDWEIVLFGDSGNISPAFTILA